MDVLIKKLREGNYSCVIENRGEVRSFTRRGVIDLFELYKSDAKFLKGAKIADKVVGKGAAALMILGGVHELYTDVISSNALALLKKYEVKTDFHKIVPHIINREGNGWCPVEILTKDIDKVEDILPLIEQFLEKMKSRI